MSVVYTKRLMTAAGLSAELDATVPAGKVWIVTDINAVARTITPPHAEVFAQILAGILFWYAETTDADHPWLQWRGRQVLVAGEVLRINAAFSTMDVTVIGYELTA